MKKIIKALCLLMALAVCAFSFAACTPSETVDSSAPAEETPATEEEVTEEEGEPELETVPMTTHEPGLFIDGEKIEVDTLITVGTSEISLDMFRYFYLSNRMSVDGGDISIWDMESEEFQSLAQTILDVSVQNALSMEAVRIFAAENNIEITQEDLDAVDEEIEYGVSQLGSQEAFEEWLIGQNMSIDIFRMLLENTMLLSHVIEDVYGEQLKTEIKETYVHAQHILITKPAETGETEASEEEPAEGQEDETDPLAVAEDVLARAQGGEDFETLIKEYNEDYGQPAEGYYFTNGTMVIEFEEAAYALEENEISDIVETTYGYHILRRLPMDDAYIDENLMSLFTGTQAEADLNNTLVGLIDGFEIEYDENFEKIAPDTLF